MNWVIKLGGSLTHHASLTHWLHLVAQHGDGKVIIVPGGGLFAEAVRQFQTMRSSLPDGHLDDVHAHRLAVFAMDQMARSFVAMVPELVLVRNPLEIAERGWQHRGLVWLPSEMVLDAEAWSYTGLKEDWQVTSDTLAAYLAKRLEATQLLLVKSHPIVRQLAPSYGIDQLQQADIVDGAFNAALNAYPCRAYVCHHAHYSRFATGFQQSLDHGLLVAS